MKSSKEILSSVVKTAQMGQIGIRSVLDYAYSHRLKDALCSQLKEYDMIETEAQEIAEKRNWELKELNPAVKFMSSACARASLTMGNIDSRIAAMMINGNTRGMIKGIKNQHHSKCTDTQINDLANKLISYEETNIQQMQEYL